MSGNDNLGQIDGSKWETCNFGASNDFMETWGDITENLNLSELNCISTAGDVLEVAQLMRAIGGKVNDVLSRASDLMSDEVSKKINELNAIYGQIRLRAFGLDKVFNPPPRPKLQKYDNSPIIVIYDEKDELVFANEAYVKVTGLNSLAQIKDLAKDKMLYEAIYDEDTLSAVRNRVQSISTTGGYVDKTFLMKNTKRNIKWNTLKHPRHNGSIRVGIDVTTIIGYEHIMGSEYDETLSKVKFNFTPLFNNYKIKLKEIFEGVPNIKQVFAQVPNLSDLNKYFEDMGKLTVIGDMIVDHGSYMVSATDGNENFMNPRYIKATGYTHEQIKKLQEDGMLINALYGYALEDHYVMSRLKSLKPDGHYNDIFTVKRADNTFVDTQWDSFCFDNVGTSFRIGNIISPNYMPMPSYTYRDVVRLFEK